MGEGEENTQKVAKCDETGQKPEGSEKYKFVLDKRAPEEAFNWIRNNIMSFLFFIAVMLLIVFTILCVHFFKESRKGPCDELVCYQENEKLKAEIQSIPQKLHQMEDVLQKLQVQIHSIEKRVEDRHSEVKKEQDYFYYGQVLLFVIISAQSIWINIKYGIFTKTPDVPAVVYFNGYRLTHLRSLIKSFWDTRKYSSTLITGEKDLSEINAKLVFLFIDANDRNIILEGENEISQLKRRTVEAVQIAGGKVVVIYQFHPDSRKLEDGCLYSEELISIQLHPVLKKLSQEGCVLSIYEEFSDYQKSHLKKLCKKYLSF